MGKANERFTNGLGDPHKSYAYAAEFSVWRESSHDLLRDWRPQRCQST